MEELREQIVEIINGANKNLPPEAIYYVVKDIYRDILESYEYYKKEKKKSKENEDKELPQE